MPQRKSDFRLGQACPASLLIAKSAEAEKAGATQHSAKQRSQSARRLRRPLSGRGFACSRFSGNGVVSCWLESIDSRRAQVEALLSPGGCCRPFSLDAADSSAVVCCWRRAAPPDVRSRERMAARRKAP